MSDVAEIIERRRLRPAWSEQELQQIYSQPHDHRIYGRGHAERVDRTVTLGHDLLEIDQSIWTVGDLSCGNAEITRRLGRQQKQLGDFAPGYQFHGSIEQTINEITPVDLFVCSETVEHLNDPDGVLLQIRAKTRYLLLSTPIDCWEDTNAEHYWAWSQAGVEAMLTLAGFHVREFDQVDSRTYGEPYCYGIWVCS